MHRLLMVITPKGYLQNLGGRFACQRPLRRPAVTRGRNDAERSCHGNRCQPDVAPAGAGFPSSTSCEGGPRFSLDCVTAGHRRQGPVVVVVVAAPSGELVVVLVGLGDVVVDVVEVLRDTLVVVVDGSPELVVAVVPPPAWRWRLGGAPVVVVDPPPCAAPETNTLVTRVAAGDAEEDASGGPTGGSLDGGDPPARTESTELSEPCMPSAHTPIPSRFELVTNCSLRASEFALSKNTWCHCPLDWYAVHAVSLEGSQ